MRIDITDYVNTWGRRPGGFGMWAFKIKGNIYFLLGQYSEVIKEAKRIANELGAAEIVLSA